MTFKVGDKVFNKRSNDIIGTIIKVVDSKFVMIEWDNLKMALFKTDIKNILPYKKVYKNL